MSPPSGKTCHTSNPLSQMNRVSLRIVGNWISNRGYIKFCSSYCNYMIVLGRDWEEIARGEMQGMSLKKLPLNTNWRDEQK